MKNLTAKQEMFVREYLIDLNATKAAERAGYGGKNVGNIAAELLGKTHIREAIESAKRERTEETKINANWVLQRLTAEAQADISDIYDDNGHLLPVKDWPLIWRQGLVQGIEVEELFEGRGADRQHIGTVRKVRLDNRVKRIELIGKHIGVNAFQDIVQHKGLDDLADRLARASKRNDDE